MSIAPLSFPNAIVPATPQNGSIAIASARPSSQVAPASTTLTLGQSGAALTYDDPRTTPTGPLLWSMKSTDPISRWMAGNFSSQSLAGRFEGLAATALNWVGDKGGDFTQVVTRGDPAAPSDGVPSTSKQQQLLNQADNSVTLGITTASGVTVQLTLASNADGMAVKINTGDGTLSATEREAIGKLADAVQGAIDGLTAQPPQLDLKGLAQYDSSVLSAVELKTSFKLTNTENQTFDLQMDATHRSLQTSGKFGSVAVAVDMSNSAVLGSKQQQANAVASYLKQFDNAKMRGSGDADLMAMFENAFTTLNSNLPDIGQAPSAAGASQPLSLTDSDHSLLTGLADFTASVSEVADKNANPYRPAEEDSFSYTVSQHTNVQGRRQADRAVTQTQQSSLTAAFHQSISPDVPLNLSMDPHTQNYYYTQIKDSSESTTELAYDQGLLVRASLRQSADQSTRVQKYEAGVLQSDVNTPSHAEGARNLMGLLDAADKAAKSGQQLGIFEKQRILSEISNAVLLQSDPAALRDASRTILS